MALSRKVWNFMDSKEFVNQLQSSNDVLLNRLCASVDPLSGTEAALSIPALLKMALKNEMEATELAAQWMSSSPHVDVKMAFARQVGDEAKHYRMIEDRLRQMGETLEDFDPLAGGYSLVFKFLSMLKDTVDRVAGGQFTRENIAVIKNRQFIALCEAQGDAETARLYREVIQPDEEFHHLLGRRLLEKYATTPELQESARMTARQTLALSEEMQALAYEKSGIHHAPGC